MTGCGRGRADEARRALSDPERQGRVRAWFREESVRRGYAPDVLARTWEIVEAFGSYGFCKAHAVAFAVPTYQSAWLKAHHPAAFYAGLLTHDPGMYPKRLLLADARRRGVPILPLDVNRSAAAYQIELVSDDEAPSRDKWGIRLALSEVYGISEAETERIVAGQPYASLQDLWHRARPGRPVAERLAQVGALAAFGGNRRDLLLHIAELHRGQRRLGARDGQLPLETAAAGTPGPSAPGSVPPDSSGSPASSGSPDAPGSPDSGFVPAGLPDLDASERLSAELGVLGMDVSRHLMSDHHAFLEELGAIPARRLHDARHGETVLVAGAKAATQTPPIRSGRRVIFTTLDDGTGLVDCAFFEDSHAACAHTVFHSWLLLVRGTVQRRGPRSLSVVGAAVWNLAELAELRRTGGLEQVAARLAETAPEAPGAPAPADPGTRADPGTDSDADSGPAGPDAPADGPDAEKAPADGRRIRMSTGYRMHPWADLRPAGDGTATGRKLWHSSPGSAGR
jgi:error-prone DNA polymerase